MARIRTVAVMLLGTAVFGTGLGLPQYLSEKVGVIAYAQSASTLNRIEKLFEFKERYAQTVDGFIKETGKMGNFWSGSKNADTEEVRKKLTREILIEKRPEVLSAAKAKIGELFDDRELKALADRIENKRFGSGPKDKQMAEGITYQYRDAIFNALFGSVPLVSERMKKLGYKDCCG